ncbi:hypothetical protein [Streptomyces sp. NBC_00388]|uniref:hypothetical protein n=1 Tax=Streptomyces sp. NBC_00388 TaxID=2975735 RepID=UPI002E201B77
MAYEQERPVRTGLPEQTDRTQAAPGRTGAAHAGRAGRVPDPTAGVQDPVAGNDLDRDGDPLGAPPRPAAVPDGSGAGVRGPDPREQAGRVPDVRGDGFETGTAGAHRSTPVPDAVAESGADPAADVRGSGFETDEAARHTPAHAAGHARTAGDLSATGPAGGGLVSAGEREELERRLQGAVSGFVDAPREAVEQADRVLDETVTRVTALLAERSESLRTSWHGRDAHAETEELRLTLRTYREVTERLLQL